MLFNTRNGAAPGGAPTAPEQVEMQAVRELLFGETQRSLETRIKQLEAQVASLEQGLNERFRELSLRFEALARTSEAQQAAMRDVGRSFSALGQQLGNQSGAVSVSSHVRNPE